MWDLLDAILDHHWTPAGKFLIFILSLSLLFGTIVINLGANSIPFGADFTGWVSNAFQANTLECPCRSIGSVGTRDIQPYVDKLSLATLARSFGKPLEAEALLVWDIHANPVGRLFPKFMTIRVSSAFAY